MIRNLSHAGGVRALQLKVDCTFDLEDLLDFYLVDKDTRKVEKQDRQDIDDILLRDLIEDLDSPENESEQVSINKIKRYQSIVANLKRVNNYECQLCHQSFVMDNGKKYCEAHHIKALSKNGSQSPENVLILCPTHHRMFHYAVKSVFINDLSTDGKRTIRVMNDTFLVQHKS